MKPNKKKIILSIIIGCILMIVSVIYGKSIINDIQQNLKISTQEIINKQDIINQGNNFEKCEIKNLCDGKEIILQEKDIKLTTKVDNNGKISDSNFIFGKQVYLFFFALQFISWYVGYCISVFFTCKYQKKN